MAIDRDYLFTYIVPVLGAFVLAAGIGGTVLGAYVPVQQSFDLCSESEMTVFPPGSSGPVTGPTDVFESFRFDQLSAEERHAVRTAITSPVNSAELPSDTPHADAFRLNGAIVTYQGSDYYVATVKHDCTSTAGYVFPLSLVGLLIGAVGMLTPIVWRRRVDRPLFGGDTGNVRSGLAMFRDGQYEVAGLVGSFGAAVVVSFVPLLGPLLGGSIVGVFAPTTRRAGVLGAYLGALMTALLGLNAAFGLLPDSLALVPASVLALVPFLGPNPLAITVVVIVAPIVFAPIAAAVARWVTRSL